MEMDKVVCKEVIISTIKRRGAGTDNGPIRFITEVFEKDGTFIAEYDPCASDTIPLIEKWKKENVE